MRSSSLRISAKMRINEIAYLILLLVLGTCESTRPNKFQTRATTLIERLPTRIVPIKYDITLNPDIKNRSFVGTVRIDVHVKETTKIVTLHAYYLEGFDTKTVKLAKVPDGKVINIEKIDLQPGPQFLAITCKEDLIAGEKYILELLNFTGILSTTEKRGFYFGQYKDKFNKTHEFATTQFQSFGARRAFPCFDEPYFKAYFTVHLVRPKDYISLSNEELMSTKPYDQTDKYIDSYRITKRMSSYLLAFVVSDYIPTETREKQRVFADKDSIENGEGEYSLNLGIQVLKKLEEFTGINYAFSKLDQIGIRDADFWASGMENWGLVIYWKSLLVYPLKEQTTFGREMTMIYIAHEYAHQWFGNLVTCEWWNYTWLNEGFATYFEIILPKMLNWDMEGLYILDVIQMAMVFDGKKDTVAMNTERAHGIIIYQKAGSVIRMLSHVVTEDVFRVALKNYLKKYSYEAVVPSNLYDSFQKVLEEKNLTQLMNNVDVKTVMTSWDSQAGYPLLTVTRNYETGEISLFQKRFFAEEPIASDASKWYIPINYVTEGGLNDDSYANTTATIWLKEDTGKLANMPKEGWILFNKQQTGYYRIMYDEKNWNLLKQQLNEKDHTKIHIYNKAQLIDDTFTFASNGQMEYGDAFELTKFLRNETQYVPIATFLKHARMLEERLANPTARANLKTYMNHILSGAAIESVGMTEQNDEAITRADLRVTLMQWLCKMRNERCKTYAMETFNSNTSSIPPNLQSIVYCGAARFGTTTEWDKLLEKFNSATHELPRNRLLAGLACTEDKDKLNTFFDISLTHENVDPLTALSAVINAGDFGVDSTFKYITTNFDKIKKLSSIEDILKAVATRLYTTEHVNALAKLAADHQDVKDTINIAKEVIQANVNWNAKYGGVVYEWLQSHVDSLGK
ncbi:aminopeptidase N-like [Photinus pyralis]|uniref:aminopeptidase N-like n=1 Tax=Photinus pyralis TaxID=7054 RepID=UPI0012674E12|nr:aminopeptidase N-like [Photinus pyralis]